MRFSGGVLDVVMIFLTIALCVSCTGTLINRRRDFEMKPKTPKIGSTVAKNPMKVLNSFQV
jgi:Na+-transporting methylmalonyl-CoA/oxaloacetate decarboxylase gamma subunit